MVVAMMTSKYVLTTSFQRVILTELEFDSVAFSATGSWAGTSESICISVSTDSLT